MSHHQINVRHSKIHQRSNWYLFWPVCVIASLLLLRIAFAAVHEYRASLPQRSDTPSVLLGEGQDLHLDKSMLQKGQLRLFEARTSGQRVAFLVQQTKDNAIHVALASCKACYHDHDSHYAKKGEMICGKCKGPMTFESKSQQSSTNSCALPEIPHKETDREVAVMTSDVLAQVAKALR